MRAAAAVIALFLTAPADAAELARVASVTDGDTFRLTTGERIRIAAIDAPETQKDLARCALERRRGLEAARSLRMLLEDRIVTIERIGRSYRRTVARVRFEGLDLADELIRRGISPRLATWRA